MALHPFDPLTSDEVKSAVELLRAHFHGVSIRFKHLDVSEPIKEEVIPYIEAERLKKPLPTPPARRIQTLFHRLDTGAFLKALISVEEKEVLWVKEIPKDIQAPVDVDELIEIHELCIHHPAVLAEVKKMELPEGYKLACEPWPYGIDDENERRRLFECYMYLTYGDHEQANHYSLPAAFAPVFDGTTKELVRIDYLPLGADSSIRPTEAWKPCKPVEYAHDLIDQPLRTDLKPLTVQQPEGPSFKVDGYLVEWQKWRFRIGFNAREGLVLYNVTYDGRNTFYRLALSEMTVPYGDPRKPYHRKQIFDIGDAGLGITANHLSLGCDCLGHIKYFDGMRIDSKGTPLHLKDIICLHEQDGGILQKHTNFRNESVTVVRNRQLVVQMICTLANYEYLFAWIFDLAGGIEFEIRASGIMSTVPIANEDGITVPWGTNVGPGVVASFHQHLFNLRIDPAVDGFKNTVIYQDSVPLQVDKQINPYGVGYGVKDTIVKKAGSLKTNVEQHRVFKIRNDSIINEISKKEVAYAVHTLPSQMLIMDPSSFNRRRGHFATQPVWVTKYSDGELFAAGEFTNQSRKCSGLLEYAARDDEVENEDVVFWHTFGLTHNPRPEDFPIMPIEKISVSLKPSSFFTKNPALDVPPSTQNINKSVLHGAHTNGTNGSNGTNGEHDCH